MNQDGNDSISNVAQDICDAADAGAHIINLSLQLPPRRDDPRLRDAIEYAYHDKGALLIAASGNAFQPFPQNPAAYPEVVAVAATDFADNITDYSSWDSRVQIAAPGGELSIRRILSTWVENKSCRNTDAASIAGSYCFEAGTSMAAPLVAGVAALV